MAWKRQEKEQLDALRRAAEAELDMSEEDLQSKIGYLPPAPPLLYESLEAVFNHKNLWVSTRSLDPSRIKYDFEEPKYWSSFVEPRPPEIGRGAGRIRPNSRTSRRISPAQLVRLRAPSAATRSAPAHHATHATIHHRNASCMPSRPSPHAPSWRDLVIHGPWRVCVCGCDDSKGDYVEVRVDGAGEAGTGA